LLKEETNFNTDETAFETDENTSNAVEITSEVDEATSGVDDQTSERDEATSEVDEQTSERDEATCERDEATSEVDEQTSERDEATSEGDEQTSERDEATSEGDEATSQRDQATSKREEPNSKRYDSTSERDEPTSERDESEGDEPSSERDESEGDEPSSESLLKRSRMDMRIDVSVSSAPSTAANSPSKRQHRWMELLGSRDLALLNDSLRRDSALVHDTDDEGLTLLHFAALYGYTEEVQCILANGADINARDDYDDTALHHAITYYHDEVARVLIDNGADISAVSVLGDTALHCASLTGQPDIIRAILAKLGAFTKVVQVRYIELMDKHGFTALAGCFYASNNLEAVKLLLQAGADPASLEVDTVFAPDKYFESPPEMPIFQLLMENCPTWHLVESDYSTLLHTACRLQNADFCHLVLDGLSDRGKLKKMLSHKNQFGETALLISVRHENLELCRLLLEYGADAQMAHNVDNEFLLSDITALEWSAGEGHKKIVKAMLNAFDEWANISRALHLAACKGELDICRLLLTCKIEIDLDHKTDNLTILQVAAYRGHADVVELLLKHGVRWPPGVSFDWESHRDNIRQSEEGPRIVDALERYGVFEKYG
jgi:ankyrin repeat protein